MARDEFPDKVKRALAARAGYLCPRPGCETSTIGPGDGPAGIINIGKASHITAASPGGPRFDGSLTSEQRSDINNGIWLCSSCSDLVDDAPQMYAVGQLRGWKHQAEQKAARRVGLAAVAERIPDERFSDEELAILAAAASTPTGEIYLMNTQQTGDFVRAGVENFYDAEDGAVGAGHVEGLEALLGRRLVRHESRQLYRLTGSGFKLGRAVLGASLVKLPAASKRS